MDDIKVAKNKKSNAVEDVLVVNNIEVVYSHVILVLKGVSLNVKKGGITGDNFLERAGNVLDIGAAGLETAGITADLTGVLAPEGLVANAIGGVVGLAGGVLDLAGDLEQELAPHNPTAAPKTVSPLSVLVTGSTGAEVKSNIQNSGVKLGT